MTAYDPNKWTSHLFDIEGSLVREIMGRVSLCVAWSAVVVILYEYGPEIFHGLAIVGTAHSMIGPALALLLVFRTNTAYDRFWEGRKQWGGIVNESRNLARQAESWLAADRDLANQVILWTTAFAYATMNRLRGVKSIGASRRGLPDDQVQAIEESPNVPFAVSRKLTGLLYEAHKRGLLDPVMHRSAELNIQALIDYCGACERIRSTPAPYGYVVHLRRALILYCLTMPFALIKDFGWETVPVTLITCYILFGIEEIGVEIENPFELMINDLPLESICATIDGDLRVITDAEDPKLVSA